MVGVNDHADDEPLRMHLFEVGEEIRQREIASLNQVRANRDQCAVDLALAALHWPPGMKVKTLCRRSLTPCGPMLPSAKSAECSARFSANTRNPTHREPCGATS